MLNQRVLAGLLAVATMTITITVNTPSSYAAPRIDPRTGQWVDEAADGTVWVVKKVSQGGQWVWKRVRKLKPPKPKTIQGIDQQRQKYCRENQNSCQ